MLAGFRPSGVLVELLNDDGSMARLPELRKIADKFGMKLVSIEDLIRYRKDHITKFSPKIIRAHLVN